MEYLILKNKSSRYISILLLLGLMTSTMRGSSFQPLDIEKLLREELGYYTDTTEQILQATKSENYFVRLCALELLKDRIGTKAIPTLKEALDDQKMEVRWRAAHLLGSLDDNSGLERMRQDFEEFAPNNGTPIPLDPNVTDPNEIKTIEDKRNLRLSYALDAATVLAELGDRRGYRLAVRMALEGAWAVQRKKAVQVLVEIAKGDEKVLASEGKKPVIFLCAVAEIEKDRTVFRKLTKSVEELRGDIAATILEKAVSSTHQSKLMRNAAKSRLARVRAKIKAAENKVNESNSQ
jgi:hypothetical protein